MMKTLKCYLQGNAGAAGVDAGAGRWVWGRFMVPAKRPDAYATSMLASSIDHQFSSSRLSMRQTSPKLDISSMSPCS
jgi:hypothetical protein